MRYNNHQIYPLHYTSSKNNMNVKLPCFFIQKIFDPFNIHSQAKLHNKAMKKVQIGLTGIETYVTLKSMKIHLAIFSLCSIRDT